MDWSQSHPKLTKFVLSSLKLSQVNPKLIANVYEAMSTSDDISKVEYWYLIVWEEWEFPFYGKAQPEIYFLPLSWISTQSTFCFLPTNFSRAKLGENDNRVIYYTYKFYRSNFQILRGLKYIHSANVLHRFISSFIIISILFSRPPLNPLIQTIHWFCLMIDIKEILFFLQRPETKQSIAEHHLWPEDMWLRPCQSSCKSEW